MFGLPLTLPAHLDHIIDFIAFMSAECKASESIRTYISGLIYMFKFKVSKTCTLGLGPELKLDFLLRL